MKPNLDDRYYLLKELGKKENQSQRALARELGFSLGKLNFVLKALVSKGLVKMENFAHNDRKMQYRYILTSEGLKEKIDITKVFIQRKEIEYINLKKEIEEAKKMHS